MACSIITVHVYCNDNCNYYNYNYYAVSYMFIVFMQQLIICKKRLKWDRKFAKDMISKINECLSKCAQTLFGQFPDYNFLLLNYLIALFCSRSNLDLQQVCFFKEGLADLLQV